MAEAVLRISTAGGAEVDALIAKIERAVSASQTRTERASRASRQRVVKDTQQGVAEEVGHRRKGAEQTERLEQLVTRAKLRELARQGDAQKRYQELFIEAHKKATAAIETEVGKRGNLSDREKRQVESLALAMVTAHEQAERRRTAATSRAEKERAASRRRFLAGSVGGAVQGVERVGAAFAQYGDDAREKQHVRDRIELKSAQIAASDIGDANAAPELSRVTQRVAELSGLDPEGVIDAIGAAQANFSALADATSRSEYLNNVLPILAQAAAASGTSLTDMVNASGEFQRQLGITNQQLPAALAQAIQAGRLGSISFGDQARHMGVIGGAAARFLSSRPEDSLQSLATTNALFQFAGRAGGGGDVSATRARAFLDNFTSARGQKALHDTLGYNVLGADGQIATREGESQTQAFQRVIQDVFTRTRGNSTRFLDTIAGSNTRSRTLGDQLFRDLRSHGGRLGEFGDLVGRQMRGTVASTIEQPFQAVRDTEANARARREVQNLYGLTGARGNFGTTSEQQRQQLEREHPVLGRLATGSTAFTAALDVVNSLGAQGDVYVPESHVMRGDRAGLQRATAREAAAASVTRDYGSVERGLMGGEQVGRIVEERTARELARLQLRDQAIQSGQNPSQVVISQQSIDALARAIINRPLMGENAQAHYEMSARHGSREVD
jgi:hypothetical protein